MLLLRKLPRFQLSLSPSFGSQLSILMNLASSPFQIKAFSDKQCQPLFICRSLLHVSKNGTFHFAHFALDSLQPKAISTAESVPPRQEAPRVSRAGIWDFQPVVGACGGCTNHPTSHWPAALLIPSSLTSARALPLVPHILSPAFLYPSLFDLLVLWGLYLKTSFLEFFKTQLQFLAIIFFPFSPKNMLSISICFGHQCVPAR